MRSSMTCWTSQYLTLPSSSKICTPSPTLSARSAFCKGLGDPCLGRFCGQEFYPPLPNRSDLWNFGAGHHVGLDHAGHMFYCRESRGRRKLDQMDTEISGFLIQLIDHPHLGHEKTLLLRFGDRGMTLDGDTWKWKSGRSRVGATGRRRCETRRRNAVLANDISAVQLCRASADREMEQIDLPPTLALLLDVPVPYGSASKPSLQLLNLGRRADDPRDLLSFLRINAWQVDYYFNACAKATKGSFPKRIREFNDLCAQAVGQTDSAT